MNTIRRCISRPNTKNFSLKLDYFSLQEQRALLKASLQRLDSRQSRLSRRRIAEFQAANKASSDATSSIQDLFLHEKYYEFEQVGTSVTILPDTQSYIGPLRSSYSQLS